MLLVDSAKTDIETAARVLKEDTNTKAIDKNSNDSVEEVNLSSSGQNINRLFQLALQAAKEHPTPTYITLAKREEILAASVSDIAEKSPMDYTSEQIKRVISDVKTKLKIKEIPPGDVNATYGSVYSFLSSADKADLTQAYQYALDNNTSLKDVNHAAFSLGQARFVEAQIRSGTKYAIYNPEQEPKQESPSVDAQGQSAANASAADENTDYVKSLLEQLKNDQLFITNPFLRTPLLQDVTSALLTRTAPSFLADDISIVTD